MVLNVSAPQAFAALPLPLDVEEAAIDAAPFEASRAACEAARRQRILHLRAAIESGRYQVSAAALADKLIDAARTGNRARD